MQKKNNNDYADVVDDDDYDDCTGCRLIGWLYVWLNGLVLLVAHCTLRYKYECLTAQTKEMAHCT